MERTEHTTAITQQQKLSATTKAPYHGNAYQWT